MHNGDDELCSVLRKAAATCGNLQMHNGDDEYFRSASFAGSENSTLQTNLDCIFGLQKNSAAERLAKFFFAQIC